MVVRWGIIGCGSVAESKGGPALYNVAGSTLTAVMSRNAAKAEAFAKRHGARKCYTKVEDLLADGEIDAVYNATPPNVHAALTIQAAEAGKHVLCEKPMAMSTAECREMICACRDHGLQLMVAYYRRCFPVVMKMRELLAAGAIGRPVLARAAVSSLYCPPTDGPRPWRTERETAGGGYLTDIGSHRIDLLIHLLGDVSEVAAFADTVHFDFDVDDSSALIMRFRSGAQATAAFNWNVAHDLDEFEVAGTKGRLRSPDLGRGELELITDQGTERYSLPPPSITHLGLVEDFVTSIAAGVENALPGEEGMKTTAVLEAAYRSSAQGRSVHLG